MLLNRGRTNHRTQQSGNTAIQKNQLEETKKKGGGSDEKGGYFNAIIGREIK